MYIVFCNCKFTWGIFQHNLQNFCPKFVQNEMKSVRKFICKKFLNFKCAIFCDIVKSYIAVKKLTTHHCGRWRETKSSRNFLYFINWSCLWYFICFHWVYNNLQFPRLILKGNVHQLIRNSIVQSQCVEQKLVHIAYVKLVSQWYYFYRK